jgi:hypothetical protein
MSESEISFHPLDEHQLADLNHQLVRLKELATDVGVEFFGDGREADLNALNILASGLKWPKHEVATFLIGLAFGQILIFAAPLSWGRAKDQWGEETALKLEGAEFFIHPISMVLKRVKKGEKIDFLYLFDYLCQQLRTIDPRIMSTLN